MADALKHLDPAQLYEAWETWGSTIVSDVYEENESRMSMTSIDFPDKYIHQTSDSTEMVQSYQSAFTPKGDVTLKPRTQRHSAWKIDAELTPRDHSTRSWESHLVATGSNPYDMPYLRYVLESAFRQAIEDQELHMIWSGKDLGVIANLPNPAQDVADGLLTHARASITLGEMVPYLMPTSTLTNAVQNIEDFVQTCLISPTWRKRRMDIHCSQYELDLYQRAYRKDFGANTHAQEFGHLRIEGTNAFLVPHAGLQGKRGFFMTYRSNLFAGYDGEVALTVERAKRKLAVMFDGEFSVNYARPDHIFVTSNLVM